MGGVGQRGGWVGWGGVGQRGGWVGGVGKCLNSLTRSTLCRLSLLLAITTNPVQKKKVCVGGTSTCVQPCIKLLEVLTKLVRFPFTVLK